MLGGLTGWHLLALVIIILLLFGAAKLPALAKSVGQSARVFKGEMKAMKSDDADAAAAGESVTPPASGVAQNVAQAPTPTAEPAKPASPDTTP